MKKLTDQTVFFWDPLPKPAFSWGAKYYHRPARSSFRMAQPPSGPADELLRIDSTCEVELLPGARYRREYAPFLSLEFVQSGSLLVRQRDNAYELKAGEVFLMQPELESEFLCGPAGCRKQSALFRGKLLTAFMNESGLVDCDVKTHPNPPELIHLFEELNLLAENVSAGSSGENSRLSFAMLQSLLLQPRISDRPASLTELLETIDRHPGASWTLSEMAERCCCSKTHLGRLFQKHLNTAPHRYLLERRMLLARRLLTDEMLSIKEIAFQCGFGDAVNFSTAFHRRFGMSPRNFRKHLAFLL